MKKFLIILPLLLGACHSEQATRAVVSMELATINYSKNMNIIVEKFIDDFRTKTLAQIDEDHKAAVKSVTKPDGSINAETARALYEKKLADYVTTERIVLDMRKKPIEAYKDVEHVMQYSAALQKYFTEKQQALEILQASSDQILQILDRFVEKK